MRCIALSQAWHDQGGQVLAVQHPGFLTLDSRMKKEGIQAIEFPDSFNPDRDINLVVDNISKYQPDWIVVDGYGFDHVFQDKIKTTGRNLLVIDDYGHASNYSADIVLNQNISSNELMYKKIQPYTRLLLGTRFVLLRREFLQWRDWRRHIQPRARRILLTLGGSDPRNITGEIVDALIKIPPVDCELRIVLGPANPHRQAVLRQTEGMANIKIFPDASNIPELMVWADIALSVGGSTSWELCFMGLPSLLLVLAENQRPIAEGLDAYGAAINLGEPHRLEMARIWDEVIRVGSDASLRAQMSHKARTLVDGLGAQRVIDRMLGKQIKLRQAEESDQRLLWELANDPTTRANSFSTHKIPWEEHVTWLQNRLKDRNSVIFIASNEHDQIIGVVRFDIHGSEATISINVSEEFRGKGYGTKIIREAVRSEFNAREIQRILAFIKPGNRQSESVFRNAGFQFLESMQYGDQDANLYIMSRNEIP